MAASVVFVNNSMRHKDDLHSLKQTVHAWKMNDWKTFGSFRPGFRHVFRGGCPRPQLVSSRIPPSFFVHPYVGSPPCAYGRPKILQFFDLPPWRYKSHIHSSLDPCVFWSVKKTAFSQKNDPRICSRLRNPREFPDSTSNRKKESRGRDDVLTICGWTICGWMCAWLVGEMFLRQIFLGWHVER